MLILMQVIALSSEHSSLSVCRRDVEFEVLVSSERIVNALI